MKKLSSMSLALLLCAAGFVACRGDEGIKVKLLERGAPLAGAEVVLMFENPPGGSLRRRTGAEGRVEIHAQYKGLRVMVGVECDAQNACARVSGAQRLEGAETTINVEGGLNLNQ
ncbi:MAG TPA: hypothetical protein VNA19_10985 [Pyrinomonadaceae bacterium]|nr:hypothetical protein [Pyrinomonadaceae bacterium]